MDNETSATTDTHTHTHNTRINNPPSNTYNRIICGCLNKLRILISLLTFSNMSKESMRFLFRILTATLWPVRRSSASVWGSAAGAHAGTQVRSVGKAKGARKQGGASGQRLHLYYGGCRRRRGGTEPRM